MKTPPGLLDTLTQHGIVRAVENQRLADLVPGAMWLSVLQALAAWLAALCVVGAFALGAQALAATWQFGLVLVAAAMALFWRYRDAVWQPPSESSVEDASAAPSPPWAASFARHLALALSLSGQALLVFADTPSNTNLVLHALLAAALSIPRTTLLHRVVCLLVALGCVCANLSSPLGLPLLGWVLSALAVVLWLARSHWVTWPHADYLAAFAHSVALGGLALLFFWHADPLQDAWRLVTAAPATPIWLHVYTVGAALLWLGCAGWLTRALAAHERGWLGGAALLIAVLGYGAPGLLVSLALALAAFHVCQRGWFVVLCVCAAGFLGLYYYSLDQTLLFKSVTLAAVGALLLALGRVVAHWRDAPGSMP